MNFAITEENFVEFCLIDMNVIIIQFPCVILHDPGPSGFNQVSLYVFYFKFDYYRIELG